MTVFCITQARMNSTRLPGKVLKMITDENLLDMHMTRVARSARVDRHILALAEGDENQILHDHCEKKGYLYSSGSVNDVLLRYVNAAEKFGATDKDTIVRLTSDCPLICPELIDLVIEKHQKSNVDYTNLSLEFFPRGFDVEVFQMSTLKKINQTCHTLAQREHVTLGIYHDNTDYQCQSIISGHPSWHQFRLCVDEMDDLNLIRALTPMLSDWRTADHHEICQRLIENPQIASLNQSVQQHQCF